MYSEIVEAATNFFGSLKVDELLPPQDQRNESDGLERYLLELFQRRGGRRLAGSCEFLLR